MRELIAGLVGAGVILLLSLDNIRCRSKPNQVLGWLFVLAAMALMVLVLSSAFQ